MLTPERFETIVKDLVDHHDESEWVEFKRNNADPQRIGEYISALSNAGALHGKPQSYLLWGIDDQSHEIVGTTFRPKQSKQGGEELENWLAHSLEPPVDIRIHEGVVDSKPVVMFLIPAAQNIPVRFRGESFIRIGSYKKKLKDHPDKEKSLWGILDRQSFEDGIVREGVDEDEILMLIDYPSYFDLTGQPLPDNRAGIIERLSHEQIVVPEIGGTYRVSNLGAILFAKRLDDFGALKRKAIRVVLYEGNNRVRAIGEQVGSKGYASGFEGAVQFIGGLLPQNEEIGRVLRTNVKMYPDIALRELIANALIHQDFLLTGTGPLIEIFSDRIEITNPGTPLINVDRFIDAPPQSRNEALASFMRRMRFCEERGSGFDKVIFEVELHQLPPPEIVVSDNHTKVNLYAPKKLREMKKSDRIRACYQHACLRWVSSETLTNRSLRQRFGIEDKNYAMASRIISDTLEAGWIKRHDPDSESKKHAQYAPIWS